MFIYAQLNTNADLDKVYAKIKNVPSDKSKGRKESMNCFFIP